MISLGNNETFIKWRDLIKRLVFTNVIWIIFSVPFFMFLESLILGGNLDYYTFYWIGASILVPTLFFPATTAMYAVLRKFIMGEVVPIPQSFVKFFKENYESSFLGGIVISLLWLILIYLYLAFASTDQMFQVILIIIAVVLLVFTLNFFAITSHLEMSLIQTFKSAAYITAGRPIITAVVGIISTAIIYASVKISPLILIIIGGALITEISFRLFYRFMITLRGHHNLPNEDEDKELEELEIENPVE